MVAPALRGRSSRSARSAIFPACASALDWWESRLDNASQVHHFLFTRIWRHNPSPFTAEYTVRRQRERAVVQQPKRQHENPCTRCWLACNGRFHRSRRYRFAHLNARASSRSIGFDDCSDRACSRCGLDATAVRHHHQYPPTVGTDAFGAARQLWPTESARPADAALRGLD